MTLRALYALLSHTLSLKNSLLPTGVFTAAYSA